MFLKEKIIFVNWFLLTLCLLCEGGVAHGAADVGVLGVDQGLVQDPVLEAHHAVLGGAQAQLVVPGCSEASAR